MSGKRICAEPNITQRVRPLRGGWHGYGGAWPRCNSLEWNDHCASSRLALHRDNRTLHPVQPPVLGLRVGSAGASIGSSRALRVDCRTTIRIALAECQLER